MSKLQAAGGLSQVQRTFKIETSSGLHRISLAEPVHLADILKATRAWERNTTLLLHDAADGWCECDERTLADALHASHPAKPLRLKCAPTAQTSTAKFIIAEVAAAVRKLPDATSLGSGAQRAAYNAGLSQNLIDNLGIKSFVGPSRGAPVREALYREDSIAETPAGPTAASAVKWCWPPDVALLK